jgi:hypothetical protein
MVDPAASPAPWQPIADSLLSVAKSSVESSAKGFLGTHAEAETFLIQATERLAKATFFHLIESDPDKKADLAAQINVLKEAIREESLSVVEDFERDAPGVFMGILETIFSAAKVFAPMVLKAAL